MPPLNLSHVILFHRLYYEHLLDWWHHSYAPPPHHCWPPRRIVPDSYWLFDALTLYTVEPRDYLNTWCPHLIRIAEMFGYQNTRPSIIRVAACKISKKSIAMRMVGTGTESGPWSTVTGQPAPRACSKPLCESLSACTCIASVNVLSIIISCDICVVFLINTHKC